MKTEEQSFLSSVPAAEKNCKHNMSRFFNIFPESKLNKELN